MNRKPSSQDRRERVRRLALEGRAPEEIAKAVGAAPRTIRRDLALWERENWGLELRDLDLLRARHLAEIQAAKRLALDGFSQSGKAREIRSAEHTEGATSGRGCERKSVKIETPTPGDSSFLFVHAKLLEREARLLGIDRKPDTDDSLLQNAARVVEALVRRAAEFKIPSAFMLAIADDLDDSSEAEEAPSLARHSLSGGGGDSEGVE